MTPPRRQPTLPSRPGGVANGMVTDVKAAGAKLQAAGAKLQSVGFQAFNTLVSGNTAESYKSLYREYEKIMKELSQELTYEANDYIEKKLVIPYTSYTVVQANFRAYAKEMQPLFDAHDKKQLLKFEKLQIAEFVSERGIIKDQYRDSKQEYPNTFTKLDMEAKMDVTRNSITVKKFINDAILEDWFHKNKEQFMSIPQLNLSKFLRIIIQMCPEIDTSNVLMMCFKSFCFSKSTFKLMFRWNASKDFDLKNTEGNNSQKVDVEKESIQVIGVLSEEICDPKQIFDLKEGHKPILKQIIQNTYKLLTDYVQEKFSQVFPLIGELYTIADKNEQRDAVSEALNLTWQLIDRSRAELMIKKTRQQRGNPSEDNSTPTLNEMVAQTEKFLQNIKDKVPITVSNPRKYFSST